MQHVSFRPLAISDLPLLHHWLNEEEVLTWYAKQPPTAADVHAKYLPRIEALDPVHVFFFAVGGTDAGLIQCYLLKDFPAYARAMQAQPEWVGLDFFIGEPRFRGAGLGARVIDAFITEYVFRVGHYTCCSSPAAANERSIRTLVRAGFRYMRAVTVQSGAVEHLMVRDADGCRLTRRSTGPAGTRLRPRLASARPAG
jgi:aminoglycoside 6'-N-acetyltransferase